VGCVRILERPNLVAEDEGRVVQDALDRRVDLGPDRAVLGGKVNERDQVCLLFL
jgi:hypothetical protein